MRTKFVYTIVLLLILTVCISAFSKRHGSTKNDGHEYKNHHHVKQDAHSEAAKKHIEEELEELDDDDSEHLLGDKHSVDELSEEDESMYWFTLSDHDGDGKLDGHELLMALNDGLDAESGWSLEDSLAHIDLVMKEDDLDGDGKISFEEFLTSEEKGF